MTRLLLASTIACAALSASAQTPCTDGVAGDFACGGVDLQAWLGFEALGYPEAPGIRAPEGLDVWGWTDPDTGREYALATTTGGTAFVDVTDPASPIVVGRMDSNDPVEIGNLWRDVKVVGDYAYVVSEVSDYGMQVFDLTRLRDVAGPPEVFSPDARYTGFGGAHNVVALPERDLVAAVGTSTCSGGLHLLDVSEPLQPAFDGCFSSAGYVHDAQCVVYDGPDAEHRGRDVCVTSNGDGSGSSDQFVVVDVTDRADPRPLGTVIHPNAGFAHQGWLTEDHRYFIANDEFDEAGGEPTLTYVFDLADLDDPVYVGAHEGTTTATDHNLYVAGDLVFLANYTGGLRVLRIDDLATAGFTEAAYFDTHPEDDDADFHGAWSVYPYFGSGTLLVSDIDRGLFVLRLADGNPLAVEAPRTEERARLALYPNPAAGPVRLRLSVGAAAAATVEVYDVLGRRAAVLHDGPVSAEGEDLDVALLPAGAYLVRAYGDGFVLSERLTVLR